MEEVKEIKSVRIVPYTLMTSSVSAVWAFIYAIFMLIVGGISLAIANDSTAGALFGVYVANIVVSPVSSFVLGITQGFLYALIYNLLVPRIGGIKLGFVDLSEIRSIPVIPVALMSACISAIMTLLIALIIVPLIFAYAGVIMAAYAGVLSSVLSNTTTYLPTTGFGALGAIGSIILIIVIPITVFIAVFIASAILAVIYNLLSPKIGGIKLEFVPVQQIHEILSIAPVPGALITASIVGLIGFIVGLIALLISLIFGQGIVGLLILLTFAILGFIVTFIVYAVLALIYNYLSPKIGGIQLELE
jgi:hypothetical protein